MTGPILTRAEREDLTRCSCGHDITNHSWAGCSAYVRPEVGGAGGCCTRTPEDIVADAYAAGLAARQADADTGLRERVEALADKAVEDYADDNGITDEDAWVSVAELRAALDATTSVRDETQRPEGVRCETCDDYGVLDGLEPCPDMCVFAKAFLYDHAQRPEGVTVTEWRVVHGGGADAYVRDCGADEHNARGAARIWGGNVQARTVVVTEWAEVPSDTEAGGDRG